MTKERLNRNHLKIQKYLLLQDHRHKHSDPRHFSQEPKEQEEEKKQ